MALPADTLAQIAALPANEEDMVRLGDISRGLLNQQAQYAADYFEGTRNTPVLTAGLRVFVDAHGNYHAHRLHRDDVATFVERVLTHRNR